MKSNISALLLSLVVLIGITSMVRADQRCPLSAAGSPLKHIVFLEFDNLHLERDVPNVPSDLEQMPHVFQFFTEHGLLPPITIRFRYRIPPMVFLPLRLGSIATDWVAGSQTGSAASMRTEARLQLCSMPIGPLR